MIPHDYDQWKTTPPDDDFLCERGVGCEACLDLGIIIVVDERDNPRRDIKRGLVTRKCPECG